MNPDYKPNAEPMGTKSNIPNKVQSMVLEEEGLGDEAVLKIAKVDLEKYFTELKEKHTDEFNSIKDIPCYLSDYEFPNVIDEIEIKIKKLIWGE